MTPQDTAALLQAFDKRKALHTRTNAMRLVNGLGDGMDGIIVELYAKHAVIYVYQSEWLDYLSDLKEHLIKNFPLEYLIVKDRTKTASSVSSDIGSQVLIDGASKTTVLEYGLKFDVDLNDGLNSGLFLDMRANRRLLGEMCANKKVLNCFAYTCSFGVHARSNGAKEVLNVDLSRNYLNRGRINYELNNLEPGRGEFLSFDAVEFLEKAVKKDNLFDVIIIDPPSFARNDKKTFQIGRDLEALLKNTFKVLTAGGTLLVSTNFSEMKHTDLAGIIKKATSGRSFKSMDRLGQDEDFPGTNEFRESYLVGFLVKL
jgi:23S rRNA (cytosine1962-C5)-methyltransferase